MAADYELKIVGKRGVGQVSNLKNAVIESVDTVLNGAGSMSYKIPTLDPKAQYTRPILYEAQVWRDGVLYDQFAQLERPSIDQDVVSVSTVGLWGYFAYRFIHKDFAQGDIDQLSIAWSLLNYAMTEWPGAGLGIVSSSFSPSGVNRPFTYAGDEHGNIASLVKDLADLKNGFDFAVIAFDDGRREWTPYYPSKGTFRSDLPLEFDSRGSKFITKFSNVESAARMANFVTATGSGTGAEKIQSSYVDAAARDAYILMQDVVSDSNITTAAGALEKAQAEVDARKNPIKLPIITVRDAPRPIIGVVKVGDTIPVRIDHGEAQLNGTYRIVAMSLKPQSDTLDLTLNVP